MKSGALLEHGEEQREALLVDAARHASRISEGAAADECLHFDQNRARPLDAAQDGRPGLPDGTLREEKLGGVRHFPQPGWQSSRTPRLTRRPKSVLKCTDDAMGVMPFPRNKHGIDDSSSAFGPARLPSW